MACPVLPEPLLSGPPVPWVADAAPAYTAFTAVLPDTPHRAALGGAVDTRIRELSVQGDRLVVGLGDWIYKPGSLYCHAAGGLCPREDAPGHGLPLLSFRPGSSEPDLLGILEEEELARIRRTGLGLLVPSTDPSRGDGLPACAEPGADPACPEEAAFRHPRFRVGNSTQVRAAGLRSEAVIPDASHVFDIVPVDGTLWALGSGVPISPPDLGGTFAMLWRSEDDGRRWRVAWRDRNQPGRRRLLSALPVGDRVLVFGLHRRDGVNRPLRYVLADGAMRPDPDLAPALSGWVHTAPFDARGGLAWSGGQVRAFRDQGGTTTVSAPDLSAHGVVIDTWLLCAGDLLVLARRREAGMLHYTVLRTDDLETFTPVLVWSAPVDIGAMAWWDGGLVFGADGHALWRTPGPDRP